MTYAFDVDGTLFDTNENPRIEIIIILKALARSGHHVVVWSGGGVEYARQRVRQLRLTGFVNRVMSKSSPDVPVDICFDDQQVNLAKINIKV